MAAEGTTPPKRDPTKAMLALRLRQLAALAEKKRRKEMTDGRDSRTVTSRTGNETNRS
jgi:hypothetical protein